MIWSTALTLISSFRSIQSFRTLFFPGSFTTSVKVPTIFLARSQRRKCSLIDPNIIRFITLLDRTHECAVIKIRLPFIHYEQGNS